MTLNDTIPIRFDSRAHERLEAISQRTGLTLAELVRRAVDDYMDRVEHDGKITIALKEPAESYKTKGVGGRKG